MDTGVRFRPSGQHELGPSGQLSRVGANLEAIRTLRVLQSDGRAAAPGEQAILARWSGWGAVPQVFDEASDRFAEARTELRSLLTEDEYAAARRTTINAHYTDAAIVRAVWDAVTGLGFDGGVVLEPGCGSGNFVGFAPPSARMLGVELDPVTAGVAAALYPDAEIRCESFADSRLPDGGFDLVIGNVPFSSAILTDPRHNADRYSMHNHFIVKSLALTRPGGLVAVLTSRYTMDAQDDSARRAMAGKADLVTGIRLPSGAHRKAAGTDAVTDLLIFRRREDGQPRAGADWERSFATEFEGGTARVSEYFKDHPENVIGELAVDGGQYSSEELIVRPGDDLARVPEALADRLIIARAEAHATGLAMSPLDPAQKMADVRPGGGRISLRIAARDSSRFEGTITAHGDGTFTVLRDGDTEPWPCPDSQAPELRTLLRLRDTVCSLLDAEKASADDTPEIAKLRARLNREYDAYAAKHGPVNRATWRRTGRTDDAGNETFARQMPAQGGFRQDPYAATVYALEDFDPETGVASKAPIFTQRVISDRSAVTSADTPADAIAICMDTEGEVRLERAAGLLGSASPEEARAALGELVYDEPGSGKLIPAAEYLSGKVRDKLAEAEKAAETDPSLRVNTEALRRVLPADLGPGDIDARLGASWIPREYVEQGLRAILQDRALTVDKGYGTSWRVKGSTESVLAREVYGTRDKDAVSLAQCLLEQRPIKVSYSMDDLDAAEKQRLKDARSRDDMSAFMRARAAAATVTARAKADELSERFTEWLWEDPERAAELTRIYNAKFNSLVLRSYDDVRPRLPGLTAAFKPHPHQYAAVARIINEPAALLAHEVGAGKTAEMVMGAMELRRLGLVTKPAIIVPNHMLEQFQREFLQLYPQARVLAAGARDLEKNRRHAFVARIATGDWDAVIMTRSVFERIPMSAAEQERYVSAKLAAYDQWLEKASAESENPRMVKRMETQRVSFEERLKRKLLRTRDAGISWEQTGIDYLFVDEAHGYKNLDTRSNNPGLDIDGSGRASDLELKLDYMLRGHGHRIVTFATATPIANSMTEAYVMTRYLRPDLLADAGIEDFDGWASSFASTVTDVEVAPEGGLRVKERVASFHNVPELLLMWRVFSDVKTAADLKLPVPELAGGKPEVVTVPASEELRDFMMSLAARAEVVRTGKVDPKEDNMLKISTDGRAAALDLRLIGRNAPDGGKLDIAADRIASIYRDTRDNVYLDRDGNPEPARGALQIVFCELGTPTGRAQFGVYEYLRAQLADRGVPGGQVRFMHEARNDKEKAELFAAARAGKISVLIGTTELMGVGTNVQRRAVALHHLDCPWRPADVAQREGRILRQGNQNPQVQVIRYVTEGSFDAYMWQTVLRKSKFIAQVMKGSLDSREIEDIGGSDTLSYSEVTALATGDMRILAKAKADADAQRLSRLESSWRRSQQHLKTRIAESQRDIPRLERKAAALEAAIARRTDMKGDAFRCELNGKTFTKRAGAAEELQAALHWLHQDAETRHSLGTFGGLDLEARSGHDSFGSFTDFLFRDVPAGGVRVRPDDPQLGIIAKLENKLTGLDAALADAVQEITDTRAEVERAHASLGAPFTKAAELARARSEADRLAAELGGQRVLPDAEPEAHETPVADAAADRDDGDQSLTDGNEAWDTSVSDPDADDAPLGDDKFVSEADDEWDGDEAEPAAPTAAEMPPAGTEPVPAHRGWGGALRPERLLYQDGSLLTVLRESEDGDEACPATAAGSIATPADSDYGQGRLQVVRWDDGSYGIVHPARARLRGTDPYAGLSQVMDLREVHGVREVPGDPASLNIAARGEKEARRYPADHLIGVAIPERHPTLAVHIEDITGIRKSDPQQAREDVPAEPPVPVAESTVRSGAAVVPGGKRPTPEQQAIIDACVSGQHLVIEAGAGAGKTSTLRMASAAMTGRTGLYVAYNKAIADEARGSFPSNVTCSTAHSLAFRAIGRTYAHRLPPKSKRLPAQEIASLLGIRDPLQLGDAVMLTPPQLAGIVMGTVSKFCQSADPGISAVHLPQVNGVTAAGRVQLAQLLLPLAVRAWTDLNQTDGRLPFSHDHYLKMWQLTRPSLNADFVLFDEAQDANPVTAAIIQGQQDAQKIAVGDSCQAIYGWRGAVDALATWPADQRLYLSQSFRFGEEIAAEANKWLESLDAVLRLKGTPSIPSTIGTVTSPDAVLCRTNAEAVSQALTMLEQGRRVALVGGGDDIKRLAEAAQELQLRGYTSHPELAAFRSWNAVQRYVRDDESGADLATFVRLVDSHGPQAVISTIDQLTSEDLADVTVSTAHKAKGREWDQVRIAPDFKEPKANEETGEPGVIPRPDAMLAYVAVTRARKRLDRTGLEWIDNYADGTAATSEPASADPPGREEVTAIPPATAPSTSTVVAPAAAQDRGIRIEHDDEGTRVYGTDRSQSGVIKALKDQGFKWSRNQGYWYLNRSWKFWTRSDRVRGLRAAFDSLGVAYDVPQKLQPHAEQESDSERQTTDEDTRPTHAEPVGPTPAAQPVPEVAADNTENAVAQDSPAATAEDHSSQFEQESLFGSSASSADTVQGEDASLAGLVSAESDAVPTPGSEQEVRGENSNSPEPAGHDANLQHPTAAIEGLESIPVDPRPYQGGRAQAESGSKIIESDFQAWQAVRSESPGNRLPDDHPRIRQLTAAWRTVWRKGLADGPGPAAARYHALAHAAMALTAATDGQGNSREMAALHQLAVHARKHSVRLRATAEHMFGRSSLADRFRGGRPQAEKGARIIEQDFRTWIRTGTPPEAARDPKLWEKARRTELAWHAVRRYGIADGPGPSAARYRELADATQALADGFTSNLPSPALIPLLQLADHARKYAIRLDATEQAKTSSESAPTRENGRLGNDAYRALPQDLATVTSNGYASQHHQTEQPGKAVSETVSFRNYMTTYRDTYGRG